LINAIAAAGVQQVPSCRGQELSAIAWAFATWQVHDVPLMSAVVERTTSLASKLSCQDIANLGWAFAKLLAEGDELNDVMSAAVMQKLGRFTSRELASIAWAFATQLYENQQVTRAIAEACSQWTQERGVFGAQSLSNLFWSFARLRMMEKIVLEKMADMTLPKIAEFSPQALANTAWSFATMAILGPSGTSVMTAIGEVASPTLSGFSFQGLCNLAWSFATVATVGSGFWDGLAKRLSEPEEVLGDADLQLNQVATLAWSFSSIGRPPPSALVHLLEQAMEQHQAVSDGVDVQVDVEMILRSIHVLNIHGMLSSEILGLARSLLQQMAREKDSRSGRSHVPPEAAGSFGKDEHPHIGIQNEQLCFLWKPKGWSMSVGKDREGSGDTGSEQTMERWIQDHFGDIFPIAKDADAQHGLLHRLDRDTSGLVAWAKMYDAYYEGRLQFSLQRVLKRYVCVCHGHVPTDRIGCFIRTSLRIIPAGPEGPKRCIPGGDGGLPSKTLVLDVTHFTSPDGAALSLVEVELHSGRLHQIRVHLSSEGFPLLGDPLYGEGSVWCSRIFLHAAFLSLTVGLTLAHYCPLPADLKSVLLEMKPLSRLAKVAKERWLDKRVS